ncbi:NAD(P)-dependent oxidoreductase [Clostridium minihomine]|uniref:NAD(P)-dependent oxidoreductase n=1 Tax=Clostridium minihomine TaxID=2045012 RepID=UPI000C75B244|nr:NAD(P)-dependent oxidoreductase [Clostridium minihomine]
MKIAVIGATGKQGGLLVQEALKRGHEVTAIVRNRSKVMFSVVAVLEKDIFRLSAEDLKGFDAVICAFRAAEGQEEEYVTATQHLISILKELLQVRLLIVGGAGSLYVDPEQKTQLYQTKDFPKEYLPTASNMAKSLQLLKQSDINWTYLSPSAEFDFEGLRTGRYTLGEEQLLVNSAGNSYITYADYAIAMMDEVEKPAHIRKRFTVVAEQIG